MAKKILIIKTGTTISSLLEEDEDFEDWFIRGSGLEATRFICCAVDRGEELPPPDEVAAAIVTGSPAFVTDFAPWNEVAAKYLRSLHSKRLPILGVCYGHQLLAWAFGGEVGFNPRGREIGTVDIELTEDASKDLLFTGMPLSIRAQSSHLQSVTALPADAILLAKSDLDPHHGFRIGANTWGIQFHPEFDAHIVRAYIRERKSDIEQEGLDVQGLLMEVEDTPVSASLLKKFVALI